MDLSKKKCNAFTFFTSKLRSDEPKIRPWKVRKSSSSLMIMMTFTKNKWIYICLCRRYCSSSSDCFNCNRIAMPFMVPPFFFSKLKSVFYQDEPRLFLNAFGIVQDSESILPQKIPSCHICEDICENISISLLGWAYTRTKWSVKPLKRKKKDR